MENKTPAIELRGICKYFGNIVANKDVDLTLYHGDRKSVV